MMYFDRIVALSGLWRILFPPVSPESDDEHETRPMAREDAVRKRRPDPVRLVSQSWPSR